MNANSSHYITPCGNNIIADAQGIWQFTPGMMSRDWVMVRMPRGIGEIAKDMGMAGCDHKLNITFLNVEEEDVEGVFEAIQLLWSPSSDSPRSGTLVIPEYGSYPHCVVTGCVPSAQSVRTVGITPTDPVGSKRYDLDLRWCFGNCAGSASRNYELRIIAVRLKVQ